MRGGVRNVSTRLDLLCVLRIVVESALVYTLQELALIILFYTKSTGQFIFNGAIVPSIGEHFIENYWVSN